MPDATLRSNIALDDVLKTNFGGNIADATVEVAPDAAAGTEYRFFRVPTSARIHGLSRISFDDLASAESPTLDIGLAPVNGNFTKDDDAINDGINVSSAAATVNLIKDIANNGKMVWELDGLSSDPGGFADIIVTIKDDATNTGGTVSITLVYSID
jgi:hypothetical protein